MKNLLDVNFAKPTSTALLVFFVLLIPFEFASATNNQMDARTIIRHVIDRDDGKTQFAKQTIATCKYAIRNRRIKCVEKPRVKVIESATKDYGKNGKDKKSIMIILEPPSERGIGFLQFDYEDQDKDSDQWMYLSALGKVKRIVSGDNNEPKTGTLFGSEFSYEDTEQAHIDDFSYKLINQEKYQNRDTWVIESRPTPEHARKSNYSRVEQWIDKERFLVLKARMYDRRGKLIKQMNFSQYVNQNGIWVAKKMNMNNVQSKRISSMKLNNGVFNIPVPDDIMSQRTLTDRAFREKYLSKLRKVAKQKI